MENNIGKCQIDANVLFSVPKLELTVLLTRAGPMRRYWTSTILAETQRALEQRVFHQTSNSLCSKRDTLRVLNNLNLYSPTPLLVGDYLWVDYWLFVPNQVSSSRMLTPCVNK